MNKHKAYIISTIGFIAVLLVTTVIGVLASGVLVDIPASGHVKAKAQLSYDSEIDFGNVSSPSTTVRTVELTNNGEEHTETLSFSVVPSLPENMTLTWDYDFSPIEGGETVAIDFTLTVAENTTAQDFSFTVRIGESGE
jgi:hypothetical protein